MVRTGSKILQIGNRLDDYAVSETVGYVILLSVIISGLSLIVLMSMPSVNSAQDSAQFNHVEQAFTTADSRISKARFSTSIFQETPFQLNEGTVVVDGSDTNSYLEIYKGSLANPYIYHTTLGTIKCVTGQGEIAYQDGGVWESSPDGGSVMISPPDFDYNGETLTLPIMRIVGDGSIASSAGGKVLVDVQSQDPVRKYPATILDDLSVGTNPVEKGKDIIIKIKSDYYLAWADFINERTRATAVVDPVNKIVTVTLKTGVPIQSGLIDSGLNTLNMKIANNYAPLDRYTIHLEKRNPGKDYFISLRPPDGTDPFLNIMIERINGPGKENIVLVYSYTDTTDPANPICEAFSTTLAFDSATEYNTLDIDLLSSDIWMKYGDVDGDGTLDNSVDATSRTWGASETVIGDTGTFTGITNGDDVALGGYKTLSDISQHYLRLMAAKHPGGPVYSAYGTEKGNDNQHVHFDPQGSTFLLKYESGEDIKYLYVTQGNLDVTLRMAG